MQPFLAAVHHSYLFFSGRHRWHLPWSQVQSQSLKDILAPTLQRGTLSLFRFLQSPGTLIKNPSPLFSSQCCVHCFHTTVFDVQLFHSHSLVSGCKSVSLPQSHWLSEVCLLCPCVFSMMFLSSSWLSVSYLFTSIFFSSTHWSPPETQWTASLKYFIPKPCPFILSLTSNCSEMALSVFHCSTLSSPNPPDLLKHFQVWPLSFERMALSIYR